jgi:hypothetical protein
LFSAERKQRNDSFRHITSSSKDLVHPEQNEGTVYIDRQAAIIFELRHFPRYYDFTERMLTRVRNKWVKDQAPHWVKDQAPPDDVLIKEIDLTLEQIRRKKQSFKKIS